MGGEPPKPPVADASRHKSFNFSSPTRRDTMKIRHVPEKTKIELQMVPMIDIVFQLLIFFIMTFKVAQMEGDFNIKMPSSAPSKNVMDEELIPPMKLRLLAGEQGQIAGIELNKTPFAELRRPASTHHAFRRRGRRAGPANHGCRSRTGL